MMKQLMFKKSVHPALWGSESWEISAHPSDPSRVDLNALFPDFPLLFKVIDAKTRLSVQVHPNEETCKVTGGEPKTEMWCALSDGPIYAGLLRRWSKVFRGTARRLFVHGKATTLFRCDSISVGARRRKTLLSV